MVLFHKLCNKQNKANQTYIILLLAIKQLFFSFFTIILSYHALEIPLFKGIIDLKLFK
jgi:hypothetical protein